MRKRSKRRDAAAIAHHYDVSNEFYALFLDPLMVYTCAYYRDPDGKLEQAQTDKLDLVCRKLDLRPGESLLDIGCGWGSLAIWAAQQYGVRAHGVTLSRAQADFAAERIRREGLEGRCLVEHLDFRDLPADATYDKIAAVGVIEHVGIPNYPAFFGRVRTMLRNGGLYLNHGITHEFHWRFTSQTEFLYRHVFPNGDLAGLTETLTEMERARLEILDVESLRLHYARTCRQWVERLHQQLDDVPGVVVEDKTHSLSVHYRLAPDHALALRVILPVVRALPGVRVICGAAAVNLLPDHGANKGVALRRALDTSGCEMAIYVGDDETDEDAFGSAPADQLLAIRVGASRGSKASFYIESQARIDQLLRTLLTVRSRRPALALRAAQRK